MAQEPRSRPEARLPAAIGRYKVVSRIGKGAMGVVYHAHDELMDRAVAIKVLTADLAGDPSIRTRFFREAKVAGQIVHPNVITVFDMGEENGRLYIVMELLQGQTLSEYLRAHPGLSLADKLDVMTQVCGGMVAAHARGVVHRDLKPSNLFVQTDGVVKLLDFGVARLADSNVTAAGLIIGTPDYMSPEQARGGEIDSRADVFSAGSVFYFLLTGRRPFAAKDLPTLLHQVEHADPPPIPEQDAPPAVAAIVMKALQKDPAKRYQSFSDLLADVLRFHKAYDAEARRQLQATRVAFREAREHAEAAAAAAAALGYESRATLEVSSLAARYPALDESRTATDAARTALQRDLPAVSQEVLRVRDQCAEDARRANEWLARHRAAEAAWGAGDLAAADREFSAVLAQQPAASATSAQLARVRAAIQEAEERARREQLLLASAETELHAGRFTDAQRIAEEVLGLAPASARARELRERAIAGLAKQQELAERRARGEALALDAGLALARGDAAAAARIARDALAADASNLTARDVLGRAETTLKEAAERASRLAKAQGHAAKARQWLDKGKFAKAIDEANRALALHPEDAASAALIDEARRRQAAAPARASAAPAWATPRTLALAGAAVALVVLVAVGLSMWSGRRQASDDTSSTPAPASPVPPEPASPVSPAPPEPGAQATSPAPGPSPGPVEPAGPAPGGTQVPGPTAPAPGPTASTASLPDLPRAPGEGDAQWTARRERALARFDEAQGLLARGRFPQALAMFESLARDEPAYPGIEERLTATRREVEATTRPSAKRLMDEGYRLESRGDMLGAMERYRAARSEDAALAGLNDRIASLTALMVARAERLISEADGDRGRGDAASAAGKYEEALRYLPPDHPKAATVRQQLERLRAGAA